MAVEVETLLIKLEARVTDFEKQMQRAQRQAQQSANGIANTFTAANARLSRVLGVLGVTLSVTALVQFIRKTVELGSSISDLSQKLGISAEDFQKLSFAASQTATDQDAVINGFRGMTQFLTAASKKGSEQAAILGKLGLSFKTLKDLSPVQVFTLLLDRIGKIQDPLRRAAVLQQVMGRSGASLGALSLIGARGLEELFKKAQDVGAVMSNQTIKTLDDTGDKLDQLGRQAGTAGGELLTKLIPPITQFVDTISSPQFQDGMAKFIGGLANIIQFLTQHPELAAVLAGAAAGGRIGGAPGAVLGGIGGAIASGGPQVNLNNLPPDSPLRRLQIPAPAPGPADRGDISSIPHTVDELNRAISGTPAAAAPAAAAMDKVATATGSTVSTLQQLIDTLPPVTDQFDNWNDLSDQAAKKIEDVQKSLQFEHDQLTRTAREQAAYNAVNQAGVDINTAAGAAIAAQARANFDLSESIDKNKAAMEELGHAAGDALTTIYEGLKAGKTAGDIFNDVLGSIIDKLANAAIDNFTNALIASLTGGGGGGGGLFGGFFKSLFGGFRASGGPVQAGRGYVIGEHGREFFVPSVSGRISNGSDAGARAAVELVLSPEIDARIRRVAGPQSERIAFNITRANNALTQRTRELKG